MLHPAHTSNSSFTLGVLGLLDATLSLGACGSVAIFSEDPGVPRDRASRFDRFVSELDLALTDTAPLLDQVRRGSEDAGVVWDAGRKDALRRAVIERARRQLDREFAPGRLDEARAVTSRVLAGDLELLAAARADGTALSPTPWRGLLVEAPSVLDRESGRSNSADLDRWQGALRTLAVEEDFTRWPIQEAPSARQAALAARTGALLAALAGSVGLGGSTDPLLGPLDAADNDLTPFPSRASSSVATEARSELGTALQRRYATAASDAAIEDRPFGSASSWEALEGSTRERWLAPLQAAAGMEASAERLSDIARAELDRLTLDLARAANLTGEEAVAPSSARLALRALRSSERPVPGSDRPERSPELLWAEARKRLGELIAAPPEVAISADVAAFFERPFGRWSTFVPGNLVPLDDPRARAPLYLAAAPEADFLPRYLREAEAWRDGIPGRAVIDAYRRAATEVPPIVRRTTRAAFEEGWGLYAVDAAATAGLLNEIDGGFGRIAQELCAFAALLVDLGLQEDGWSQEQAVAFLLDSTPLPEVAAAQLAVRCLAHPGRAALPAIGLLRFRALRRGVEAALGDRFDLASFHAALLEGGPVPMGEIDLRIQRWLRRGAPGPL